MSELPEDVWRRIMQIGVENSVLDFKDLCRLSLTCKCRYKLSGEDALWSSLLYQDFHDEEDGAIASKKGVYKHRYLKPPPPLIVDAISREYYFIPFKSDGGVGGLRSLVRRKQVDSAHSKSQSASGSGHHQLAKALTVPHLIAIGVGSTIGAGVYILVGTVAREHSGPALTFSFLIAGIAAALSAFCYAELASRCPSAGSAYHYSYICVGEGVAWLIGWALILEYTIGGSAVARGISPNLALLFGGPDSLPSFLARQTIPGLGIVVDPCAAILVFVVTGLLCVGIKESTFVQGIVTAANTCAMIFVIVAGGYLGFKTGWPGYELPVGYGPYHSENVSPEILKWLVSVSDLVLKFV
ncbi:unnamed protein product [Fraxinus pennsylvanica]|uniref:F-box domain-containing protein n=1 Tax=Fraxinus pennsylvanica TaxID=56036 RepID=A0AAD2A627_9LAMI|nr:unnamed protein product [Fraxinus pennsylvanica]